MHILHTFYVSAFELADDDKIQSLCKNELRKVCHLFYRYSKVASSSLSWLVAHFWIFRLFVKGKFDAYVL